MRAVGLKILRNKLSEYVRMAAGGETVLITDRDRVVAELTPPAHGRAPTLDDDALAALVREGWLTPPLLAAGTPPDSRPVARLATLLDELRQNRAGL